MYSMDKFLNTFFINPIADIIFSYLDDVPKWSKYWMVGVIAEINTIGCVMKDNPKDDGFYYTHKNKINMLEYHNGLHAPMKEIYCGKVADQLIFWCDEYGVDFEKEFPLLITSLIDDE